MKCSEINCRTTLWYLVFLGCAVNYMIRSNINIAIVAMVKDYKTDELNDNPQSECSSIELSFNYSKKISNETAIYELNENRFDWDEREQNYALGAFYWTYWMTQISGGTLAQIYGTKYVFGLSNLSLCVTTLLIPLLSKWNLWALVTLRIFQGLLAGLCWPSLHDLVATWIPPNERSKFMSAYTGSSIGAATTYPLCGLIIHFLGWEFVFYVTAALGILWFCLWWLLVHDTPAAHPRITHKELSFIQQSIGESLSRKKIATPWSKMLTSGPLWLTIFVSWGCLWGMFTLLTQAPTYFQVVHGWGIRMNGILSGIPHIGRTALGIGLAQICDYLLQKGYCSRTSVRKIAAFVCCLVQGIFLVALAFSGCNVILAAICVTVALASTGAEAPGPLASYVDLSPNHASILFGLANMMTVFPAFLSAIIVGHLTYQNQTVGQWQIVFFISAAMTVLPGVLYLFIGNSDVQPWNDIDNNDEDANEEMQNLKNKPLEDKQSLNTFTIIQKS